MGLPVTHLQGLGACEAHFYWLGLVPNQSLQTLIAQIVADVVTSSAGVRGL